MDGSFVEDLRRARDRLVAERRDLSRDLAAGDAKLSKYIDRLRDVQYAIEAVDNAIRDEERIQASSESRS